jgi:Zn-dependent protease
MVWVAAAGPATNIALAFASAVLIRIVGLFPAAVADWATATLSASVLINLILAVFNMLPLPPLDGGRVAVGLLPDALAQPLARLERWGLLIIIGMLFILPFIGAQLGVNLSVFRWLVGGPVFFLVRLIETITGASLEF